MQPFWKEIGGSWFELRLDQAGPFLSTFIDVWLEEQMDWVLLIVIASTTPPDKVINVTTVPIATEVLCNAARAKVIQAYKQTQSPDFLIVGECLQAR
jgi:hypothetical protein